MKPRLTLVAIILMLSFAAPVAAGPFEAGLAAVNRGDYPTALRLLGPLADQGHAIAQYHLGVMYDRGQGVPQDYAEAVKWYRLAAEQGCADAQTNLGLMYERGQGVRQNYAEAAKWYRKAAEQGNAEAKFDLGRVKWYRLAANKGIGRAQHILGLMYRYGRGVQKDYVRAHMWFNLAAAQGEQLAVKSRDAVARLMTPAQIAEAQKMAREWKPTKQPPR